MCLCRDLDPDLVSCPQDFNTDTLLSVKRIILVEPFLTVKLLVIEQLKLFTQYVVNK